MAAEIVNPRSDSNTDNSTDSATDEPFDPAFALHRGGKMAVQSTVPIRDKDDLSLAYTPGVAKVCSAIAENPELVHDYTWKSQVVAVVTDGTAVLGLGDIGPEASLPVMEGKAILFKQFGGVDAVPIALATTDADEIVETVVRLAPSFGGVNLEDISAPRCFEIERKLKERLDIPVFHDDQHGTAVVTLAALRNAAKLSGRTLGDLRGVISGAGAAGVAIAKFLLEAGLGDVAVADRKGVVSRDREDLTDVKRELAELTNRAADLRNAGDRAGRCGRLHRCVRRYGAGGGGRVDGARCVRLRHGQSGPGGPPRHRAQVRGRGGDGALRLPEPDQQRAGVPGHLRGGAAGAGVPDHGGHEDCRRERAGGRRG